MKLHDLKPAAGSRHRRKIVGRGVGSGHGKTAGKGHKGQLARAGGNPQPWHEGGQLPLHRRIPKRGFTNPFPRAYAVINLRDLEAHFPAGATVTVEGLRTAGLLKGRWPGVKILGKGELTKPLTVTAHRFSKTARAKIEAAEGRAEVVGA